MIIVRVKNTKLHSPSSELIAMLGCEMNSESHGNEILKVREIIRKRAIKEIGEIITAIQREYSDSSAGQNLKTGNLQLLKQVI